MFDPAKLYPANDPEIEVLGTYSTLASWRHEGRGPAFIKVGTRVLYRGSDLNSWLESRTVRPRVDDGAAPGGLT